jgi:O-antigen/teichoic acid export membrane protein
VSEPPENPEHSTRLALATRSGISWNLAGALTTNGMRVLVIAVLGRTLTADDFGVVAAAVSVNVILYSIRDVGVGQALIQRRHLEPGHLTTAFAVSFYLGLALSALLGLAAPMIGRLYGIPASVEVIRVLGLLFAVRGVSAVSRMVCQRDLLFRPIAMIDALAFALGSLASIGAALAGGGPWALVVGYLVEEALASACYLRLRPPRLALGIEMDRLRELLSFGAGQTVAQVAGILATYGDNFVVGNSLGSAALGYYTRAYELIKFPSTVFASVVGSVLFPALSRLQDDRARLAASFRRLTFVNALVLLPTSALLVVLAPEAIRLLVGEGWEAAILAVTMLFRTSQKLGAIVAQAAGEVNAVARAYVVYMILVIGGAMLAIRWDIIGVATSTAIAIAVVGAQCSVLAMRTSGLPLAALLAAHLPGLLLAGVVAVVSLAVASALRASDLPSTAVLALAALAASLPTIAVLGLCVRRGRGDFAWLRDELGRLHRRLRPT